MIEGEQKPLRIQQTLPQWRTAEHSRIDRWIDQSVGNSFHHQVHTALRTELARGIDDMRFHCLDRGVSASHRIVA